MGVVYKATQVTLNRTVAVKMLPPHLALSKEYLARFQREAETLARLAHENIVHIYDIEEQDDAHFIIMELVSGGSLSSLLQVQRRINPAHARDIATRLADALAAAHHQGIIHRDIKPDNILFSTAGQPKLTDFGIAHMRDTKFKTQTGLFLGTPLYISPEQARGQTVSAASDLYSLGIVLYEMLCGHVPFSADDPLAVALKHIQEAPTPLNSVAADLPASLCAIVHRMIEKAPGDRYSSAREVQEALLMLDLGMTPGMALRRQAASPSAKAGEQICPECHTPLKSEFLTCPKCGRAIRRSCVKCGQQYDPLSPECPFCRTPASISDPSMAIPAPPPRRAPGEPLPKDPQRAVDKGRQVAKQVAKEGLQAAREGFDAAAEGGAKIVKGGAKAAADGLGHGIKAAREGLDAAAEGGARIAKDGARVAAEGVARAAEHVPGVTPTLMGRLFAPFRSGGSPAARYLWIGVGIILLALLILLLKPLCSRTPIDPFLSSNEMSSGLTSGTESQPVSDRQIPNTQQPKPRVLTEKEKDAIAKLAGEKDGATEEGDSEAEDTEDEDATDWADSYSESDGYVEEEKDPADEEKSEEEKPKEDKVIVKPPVEETPVAPENTKPPQDLFDEAGARQLIRSIIDRQKKALQEGNVSKALADASSRIRKEYEPILKQTFEYFKISDIRLLNLDVDFDDNRHANVWMSSRFTLTSKLDGSKVTEEGEEAWKLAFDGKRWWITEIQSLGDTH